MTAVALFIGAKVVFMFANRGEQSFTLRDVAEVVQHGLTLDMSTALYIVVIPFLLTIVSIWYTGKWLDRAMHLWFAITAVACGLAFTADTALYPHWGFKLDASCLQYLSTPGAAAASVPTWALIVGAVFLVVLIVGIYGLFRLQYHPLMPLRKRWLYGLCCIVMAPLIFIGIRGGVEESTTNIGQVYYSQTPFFNHSAVNPVFSFLSSFEGTMRDDVHYSFMTSEECDSLLAGAYSTESIDIDTLLTTRRPNVVLVMLESAGGQFMKIGGKDYVMPRFNQLCDEGVFFSQCYANSFRTDRATVSIWSGHLSFPTISLQKIPKKNSKLPGLARTLVRAGYDTHFFYGGDINFTKMRSYLINSGFDRFTYDADFTRSEQRTAQWGVCDSIMFDRVRDEIQAWSADDKKPHLIGFCTLSSHEPWDVPIHELEDPVENAFYYLDQCIGRFVDELRRTPQWDNLLLIFIPDHGVKYAEVDETKPLIMHIPVLWMGGAVKEPRVVDFICNQSDQAATLLGQMGINHDDYFFSRDVMSKTYTKPFAYHTFNNGFSMVDSTGFVVYDLTSETIMAGDNKSLVGRGKAILQHSSEDLSRR